MLDYFISFCSVLHFTAVSRRLFSLVGRLSGNDDGDGDGDGDGNGKKKAIVS